MPKIWRCLLHGTSACSKDRVSPCTWGAAGEIVPPFGCHVGAFILLDHVEKVEKETT